MASRKSYVPPMNPDSRPLPAGWTQHYDPQRKLWIYLDMNILPPVASLIHPAGPITASPTGPASSPTSASNSPKLQNPDTCTSTPYTSAIQAARERQEKTLAQQLYSSALPRKHHEPKSSTSGALGLTPSPDYQDAAPAYGSIDPSTFAHSPAAAWTAATGAKVTTAARSTSSHVSQGSASSSTSSGSRRPLPAPPSQFSSLPPKSSPPGSPPPFPNDTEGLLQPTPLKADNGNFNNGVKSNLAETLLQAIPELDATPALASAVRDHGLEVKEYASGLRSKPPSYSTIMRPSAVREKMGTRPPPLAARNDPPTQCTSTPTTYLGSVDPHAARRRSGGIPQDDSELIPPDSARTVTSFDPSPIYSSGIPEGSIPLPQSRPISLVPPSKPTSSPTLPSKPSSPSPAPSQVPNKPPRNAFVPAEIMAIANRNMQASASSAHYSDLFDPSSLYSGKQRSTASSPQPNTPSPGPGDRQTTLARLQESDGLADSSTTSHSHSHSPTSMSRPARVRPASRDFNPTEAPWSAFFPSPGSISGDNDNSSGEPTKKEHGMGGKFKKLGSGFSKAAEKGFAAFKRPSVPAMRSSSRDACGDGLAEMSRQASFSRDRLYQLPSSEQLPSLIEDVKIASPTLGIIPLLLEGDSRHSTSQSSSSRPTSHDFEGMSYVHVPPTAKPVADRGYSGGHLESRSDLSMYSNNSSKSSKSPHIPALRALDTSAHSLPLHPQQSLYGDAPSQKAARAVNILASLGPKHGPVHRPPRVHPAANVSARLDALGPQHPPLQRGRPSVPCSNASTPSMSSGAQSSASKNAVSKAAMIFGHYGQR